MFQAQKREKILLHILKINEDSILAYKTGLGSSWSIVRGFPPIFVGDHICRYAFMLSASVCVSVLLITQDILWRFLELMYCWTQLGKNINNPEFHSTSNIFHQINHETRRSIRLSKIIYCHELLVIHKASIQYSVTSTKL